MAGPPQARGVEGMWDGNSWFRHAGQVETGNDMFTTSISLILIIFEQQKRTEFDIEYLFSGEHGFFGSSETV